MVLQQTLTPYLTSIWGRRIAYAAVVVASLLLLMSLTNNIAWLFSLQPQAPAQINNQPPTQIQVQRIPNIAAWHLFGVHEVIMAPKQVALIPKTTLQLKINGIFKDKVKKRSEVIISAPGQPGKLYGVGDTVPGGAVIVEILSDSVILQHNGQLEKLILPTATIKFGPLPRAMNFINPSQ